VSGLLQSVNKNVRPDDAIVLSSGAAASLYGSISRTAAAIIADAPGVQKDAAGRPEMRRPSPDHLEVTKKERRFRQYRPCRPRPRSPGDGQKPAPDRRPALPFGGARADRRPLGQAPSYKNLNVGDHVMLRGTEWSVVGVFEDNGGQSENALIGDSETVMSAFQRTASVRQCTAAIARRLHPVQGRADQQSQLSVEVKAHSGLHQGAAEAGHLDPELRRLFHRRGDGGRRGVRGGQHHVFAVDARAREIATLRAIGFGGTAVVISVMVESLLLAIPGALIGVAIAWVLFQRPRHLLARPHLSAGGDARPARAGRDLGAGHRPDRRSRPLHPRRPPASGDGAAGDVKQARTTGAGTSS